MSVFLIRSEPVTPAHTWKFQDVEGQMHELAIAADEILVDHYPCHLEISGLVSFMSQVGTIRCTQQALWFAIVGRESKPTVQEAGRLIAENLALWSRLRQVQLSVRASFQQSEQMLKGAQPLPYLPSPHLEPFVEELLSRCPESVSGEQLAAFTSLLGYDLATVIAWLEQRGKVVCLSTFPLQIDAEIPGEDEGYEGEPARGTHIVAQENIPAHKDVEQASLDGTKMGKRSAAFHWTPEQKERLAQAICECEQENPQLPVKRRIQIIAERLGWPVLAVRNQYYVQKQKRGSKGGHDGAGEEQTPSREEDD